MLSYLVVLRTKLAPPAWLGSKACAPATTAAPVSEADMSEMLIIACAILSCVNVCDWIRSRYEEVVVRDDEGG